mgnify:CR=1 FL=1
MTQQLQKLRKRQRIGKSRSSHGGQPIVAVKKSRRSANSCGVEVTESANNCGVEVTEAANSCGEEVTEVSQ